MITDVLVRKQQAALEAAHQVVYINRFDLVHLLLLNHANLVQFDVLAKTLRDVGDHLQLQFHVGFTAELFNGFYGRGKWLVQLIASEVRVHLKEAGVADECLPIEVEFEARICRSEV